jgi:hypothetical protein
MAGTLLLAVQQGSLRTGRARHAEPQPGVVAQTRDPSGERLGRRELERPTYDWSAVGTGVRASIQLPPFGQEHLDSSLQHLSDLVA